MLSRLTSSLCDAVTAQDSSQEILSELANNHFFLEQLDQIPVASATHTWYRYHTLFAEALRQEASRRLGEGAVRQLWLRASYWYEANDQLEEALDTALAAQTYERKVGADGESSTTEFFKLTIPIAGEPDWSKSTDRLQAHEAAPVCKRAHALQDTQKQTAPEVDPAYLLWPPSPTAERLFLLLDLAPLIWVYLIA
jgi:hypothetical protein